jgi:hypothetical protein
VHLSVAKEPQQFSTARISHPTKVILCSDQTDLTMWSENGGSTIKEPTFENGCIGNGVSVKDR